MQYADIELMSVVQFQVRYYREPVGNVPQVLPSLTKTSAYPLLPYCSATSLSYDQVTFRRHRGRPVHFHLARDKHLTRDCIAFYDSVAASAFTCACSNHAAQVGQANALPFGDERPSIRSLVLCSAIIELTISP